MAAWSHYVPAHLTMTCILETVNLVVLFDQAKGLEDILQTALIQNKSDFVDLLMDHIHMGNFVTKKRMLELYNSVQPTNLLYRVLKVQKNKVRLTQQLIHPHRLSSHIVGQSRYFFMFTSSCVEVK